VVLHDHVGLLFADRRALDRELAELVSLHDVVRSGLVAVPPREVVDVVVQDEFTHDVVVRWSDRLYLVFDTT
jgi:hypothetical protein